MTDKENALGELLAAEACYLRTRGWIPSISGVRVITWKLSESGSRIAVLSQLAAVRAQRKRETHE